MNRFRRIIFVGFLLASVPPLPAGWAQTTGVASSDASPQATALPDTHAPPRSAFPSASLATKKKSANSPHAGGTRAGTAGVSGKTGGTLQELYFQPGVGWLNAPQPNRVETGLSQAARTASFNSKAEEHEVSGLNDHQLGQAANPESGQPHVQGTASTGLPESLRNLARQNYVSPIKLRRITRGAPRLETRLNLDRLASERRAPMEKGKKRNAKNNCSRQTKEDDEAKAADQYMGTAPCRLSRGQ
jgi:hypothetical protein